MNLECSIYAHGHLNLMRGRRHLGLRSVLTTLTAGHATRIALSLSHSNLSAVHRGLRSVLTTLEPGHATRIALSLSHANLSAAHRALERGYPVKATVVVEAGSGTERQEYSVSVALTWR